MAITKYPAIGPAEEYRLIFDKTLLEAYVEETNQRTIKMLETDKQVPLIDEYAVDTNAALFVRCFEYAVMTVADELRSLMRRGMGASFDSTVEFPIIFSTGYQQADLDALDEAIREAVIYRTLRGWYTAHDNEALVKKATDGETMTLLDLKNVVRRMTQALNRPYLSNPFSVN